MRHLRNSYLSLLVIYLFLFQILASCDDNGGGDVKSMTSAMEAQQGDVRAHMDKYPAFIAFSDWLFSINIQGDGAAPENGAVTGVAPEESSVGLEPVTIKVSDLKKALTSFLDLDFNAYILQELERLQVLEEAIQNGDQSTMEAALAEDVETYFDVLMAALYATDPTLQYEPITNDLLAAAVAKKTQTDYQFILRVFGGFFLQFSDNKEAILAAVNGEGEPNRPELFGNLHNLYYGEEIQALINGGLEEQKEEYLKQITALYNSKLKDTTATNELLERVAGYKETLNQLNGALTSDNASLVNAGFFSWLNGGLVALGGLFSFSGDEDTDTETPTSDPSKPSTTTTTTINPTSYVTVGFAGFSTAHSDADRGSLETIGGVGSQPSAAWNHLPKEKDSSKIIKHYLVTHFESDDIFDTIISNFQCSGGKQSAQVGLMVMANSWGSAASARLAEKYQEDCGRLADLYVMIDGVNKRSIPPIWSFRDKIATSKCINYYQRCDSTCGDEIPGCTNNNWTSQCPHENGTMDNHIWIEWKAGKLGYDEMMNFIQ